MKKFITVISFCLTQVCCQLNNIPTSVDHIITNAIHDRYNTEQDFIDDYMAQDSTKTSEYISAAYTIIEELQKPSAYAVPPSWANNNVLSVENLLTNKNSYFAYMNLFYISMAQDDNFIDSYIKALRDAISEYSQAPAKNLEYARGALGMLEWLKAHPNVRPVYEENPQGFVY